MLKIAQSLTGCDTAMSAVKLLNDHNNTIYFNSNTLMMLWWLLKGCMGQRFCNAVVQIAELLHVKKSEIEISLTTLFQFS